MSEPKMVGKPTESSYSDFDVHYGKSPMSRTEYFDGTIHTSETNDDPVFNKKLELMDGDKAEFSKESKPGDEE